MEIGIYVLPATAAVLLLELLRGAHRGIYSRNDFATLILCIAVARVVTRPFLALAIAFALTALFPAGRGALADIAFLPAYLVLLFACEFTFYWVHRWAHEAKGKPGRDWLWKLHRTHHAGKYMNVLVTLRIHPLWTIFVPTTWILGAAVYFGQEPAAVASLLTVYGWNLVTHAHFRWDDKIRSSPRFGPAFRTVEKFLVSPGIHHTHHGYGRDGAAYRNYAVTFSFLDRLFGTLHIPEGRPAQYGLPGPTPPWYEEVFFPLFGRTRGRRAVQEAAASSTGAAPRIE